MASFLPHYFDGRYSAHLFGLRWHRGSGARSGRETGEQAPGGLTWSISWAASRTSDGARLALQEMIAAAATNDPGLATTNRVMIGRTLVARGVLKTVEVAMEAAGARAFYRSAGMERFFRDAQAAIPSASRGRTTSLRRKVGARQ